MTDSRSTLTAMAEGRPVLGVSVSVWRGDEVLLIRRGREPAKGLWSPVGGKVDFGETLADAARREVAEETGVACEILGLSDLRELIMPDRAGGIRGHVVLAVFAARWLSGEAVAGDDAEAVAWVHADALAGRPLVEGVIPYILATRRLTGGAAP
jgi:8-oxo-dGTP diphosphatase